MEIRTGGTFGCLFAIIVLLIIFYFLRFTGWLVFGTPVGLVLVGYWIYKYFKRNNHEAEVTQNSFEAEPEFNDDKTVIDVDYEEVDSDR